MANSISLICAVYGEDKAELLKNLIASISLDTDLKKELIIVDQNDSNNIEKVLKSITIPSQLTIKYLKSKKGLSRSRNKGLLHAKNNIICFPDDDCEYPQGMLLKISDFFLKNDNVDVLITSVREAKTNKKLRFTNKKHEGRIRTNDVFTNGCSISIFLRNKTDDWFDEDFGLGATYRSCEDYDYVLRLIKKGLFVYFKPSIYVFHPNSNNLSSKEIVEKVRHNASGHGAFFRKHKDVLFLQGIYNILSPLFGTFLYLLIFNKQKSMIYKIIFFERLKGYLKYKKAIV